MSPRGRRPTTSKSGPKRGGEQGQTQVKTSQLYTTPPWAKSRRSQEAVQQNWTQGGQPMVRPHPCRCPSSPTFSSRFIPPCPMSVLRCLLGSMYLYGGLELSMWGSSIFHGHSLLSTYKRRPPLLISLNQTLGQQHQKYTM